MFGSTSPQSQAQRAAGVISDTTTANFREDVLVASTKQAVLVDFWAPWCGPCKQLTPSLEKSVKAAGRKVRLVKMNIEEHPEIAGQLGIQSIPAVMAFQNGQPVDGFVGALPESQIRQFIERLVGPIEDDLVDLLQQAEQALANGQADEAAALFDTILEQQPEHIEAIAGRVRTHLALGEADKARGLLDAIPATVVQNPKIAAAKVALDVADHAASLGDLADLKRKLGSDPNDHQSRLDLALSLSASGDRTSAADELLYIIQKDRKWNEDAARKQLIQLFEAWGPMDPHTVQARKKLSRVLFS